MAASNDAQAACISEIKALIGACKGGLPFQRLDRDFRETIGTCIEYRQFGFPSLLAFLRSVPEIHHDGVTLTVCDPKMAHITNMVSRQRSVKKNPKASFRTARMSHGQANRHSLGSRRQSYVSLKPSNGFQKPSYASQRNPLPGGYAQYNQMPYAPMQYKAAPQQLLPHTSKPALLAAPIGVAQPTRYGGSVVTIPARRGVSTGSGGPAFKSSLRSVEKQMRSASINENISQPNFQKHRICELDGQENMPRLQNGQDQHGYQQNKCLPKQNTDEDRKYVGTNVGPSAYTYKHPPSSQSNSQKSLPKTNYSTPVNVDSPPEVVPLTPTVNTPVESLLVNPHQKVSLVNTTMNKPVKLRPFVVMDSNVNKSMLGVLDNKQSQSSSLTPSERLNKFHARSSLPTPPTRCEVSQPRTVVVEQKLLTVQIDNSHSDYQSQNGHDVRLEYGNDDETEEGFEDNQGSCHGAPLGEISHIPENGIDARYMLLKPIYKHFQLIGDNFFLNMSMAIEGNDITPENSRNTVRVDGKPYSMGLCISGLSIEDCFNQLVRCKVFRERVVLMVGSIDVMKGKTFPSMKMAMARVIEFLLENKVTSLVICTLPPILTANQKQRNVLMEFNEYISHMAVGSRRIFCFNIFYKFLLKDSNMDHTLFDREATILDVGKVVKVHLWSRKGCKMVLHEFDKYLNDFHL